jgi:hypothetical protein
MYLFVEKIVISQKVKLFYFAFIHAVVASANKIRKSKRSFAVAQRYINAYSVCEKRQFSLV